MGSAAGVRGDSKLCAGTVNGEAYDAAYPFKRYAKHSLASSNAEQRFVLHIFLPDVGGGQEMAKKYDFSEWNYLQ